MSDCVRIRGRKTTQSKEKERGGRDLGQQDAVLAQEVGAAGAQGRLAAEVGHDGHQAVAQAVDHHALWDARHQAQRVDEAADVVQQRACRTQPILRRD